MNFAQQFGVSTILLLMPMQLSTGMARNMSPITAVVVATVAVPLVRVLRRQGLVNKFQ